MVGGVAPVDKDAVAIDSKIGNASASGHIAAVDTLSSFGQTMLAGVGVAPDAIRREITKGKVIASALS